MSHSTHADTDREYSAFDPDLPRVQIPLGRNTPGLTIEGKFISYPQLLPAAQEAYRSYLDGGPSVGATTVHMCDDCADRDDGHALGYLTTSDNIGDYRSPYTCPNEWTEESTSMNGASAGMWGAPHSWCIDLKIDGDDTRVVTDDSAPPTYTLTIRQHDRYHADADVLGETTVTLPDHDTTIIGETNGHPWEADITHNENTISVDWREVRRDTGDTVVYTYETGDRGPEREFLATNVADQFADKDGYESKELATTVKSRVHTRECGNTTFTRVWPPQELLDDADLVPLPDLDADDVPNASSHLSRIQTQCENSKSRDVMLREVAKAYDSYWDDHPIPDWVDYRSATHD